MLPDGFLGKTACCFTGHRPAGLPDGGDERSPKVDLLKYRLLHAVEETVQGGVRTFLCGGAPGFDLFAGEAVLALRGDYPGLQLILALPSKTQSEGWPEALQKRYARILENADACHYASENDNSSVSMFSRNRYLVDHGDCCIAYLTRMSGGTLYTVNYALEQNIPVWNLAQAQSVSCALDNT